MQRPLFWLLLLLLFCGLLGAFWLTRDAASPDGAPPARPGFEDGAQELPAELAGRLAPAAPDAAARQLAWTLRGRVLTPQGDPVAGVPLALWPTPRGPTAGGNAAAILDAAWKACDPNEKPVATTISGADGRFRFHAPLTGLWMIVEARPVAPQVGTSDHVLVRTAHDRDVVVVVMPGTALRGQVVDAQGEGVRANVLLSMYAIKALGGASARHERRTLRTGADGGFHVAALPAGRLSVDIHVPGRRRRIWTIGIPHEGVARFRLYGGDGAQVSGTVRDKAGRPVPHVRVVLGLRVKTDDSRLKLLATTDGAGTYQWQDLPLGVLGDMVFGASGYLLDRFYGNGRLLKAGESLTIDRVLHRGTALEGHVRTRDGVPVEGASVRVRCMGGRFGGYFRLEARTRADGSYRVDGLPVQGRAEIRVDKDGFYQPAQKPGALLEGASPEVLDQQLGEEQGATKLEIVLAPGVPIEGRTVVADGAPVASAEISLRPAKKQPRELANYVYLFREYPSTRSDEQGRFRFAGLPPGTQWELRARTGELETQTSTALTVEPRSSPLEVVLVPATSIEGAVVYPDGKPAPGLRILVDGKDEGIQSGIGGRFVLSPLSPGPHRIAAGLGRSFLVTEPVEVTVQQGEPISDVRLTTRAPLITTGRLLAADGTPLASARATLQPASQRSQVGEMFDTDTEGHFELRHWRAGSSAVRVGRVRAGEAFELGTRGLELRLPVESARDITVRVLAPDGNPVYRCTLVVMTGVNGNKSGSYRTVDGGVYALATESLQKETDLIVRGALDANGEPLDVRPVNLVGIDTSQPELVIRLVAGRALRGQVLDADGAPVVGLSVTAAGSSPYGAPSSRTDEQGHFALKGLPAGVLRIRTSAQGAWLAATVEIPAGQDEVQIRLTRGVSFAVEVVGPEGRPAPGVKVTVQSMDARGGWRRRGQTDAEGWFRMEGIPKGDALRIDVDTRGGDRALPSTRRHDVPNGKGSIRITLREPVWIEGVLVDPEGKPVGGAGVTADGKSEPEAFAVNLRTTSDPKTGRFRLGPLEEGTYRVSVVAPRNLGLAETGQVKLHSPATNVRLVLPRETQIEGTLHVSDPQGWRLGWYARRRAWSAVLGPEGHFRIERVADLPGMLWAQGPGGRYSLIEGVRPGAGPFALQPEQGGRIRGRIEGPRIKGRTYYVTADRGLISVGTAVGEDGTFAIEGVPPGNWRVVVYADGAELGASEGVQRDAEPVVLRIASKRTDAPTDGDR